MFRMKVVENEIFDKKVSEHLCLSLPGVELGCSKDWYVWNTIMYWNGKVESRWDSMLPKIPIIIFTNPSFSRLFFWEIGTFHPSISNYFHEFQGGRNCQPFSKYKLWILTETPEFERRGKNAIPNRKLTLKLIKKFFCRRFRWIFGFGLIVYGSFSFRVHRYP